MVSLDSEREDEGGRRRGSFVQSARITRLTPEQEGGV